MPEVDRRPGRPRVFGVGLNKTATSSFHEAMTILGYESLHWGGPAIRRCVEEARAADEPLLARLDPRIDAFSDILALSVNYDLLDEQYPGSRFVLTLRPIDEWVDSRRRHVQNNLRRQARGEYDGSFLVVDEPAWRAEWLDHIARVRAHFAGRAHFLEIDISRDPRWAPLCTFLGLPEPAAPFPWVNRTQALHPIEDR